MSAAGATTWTILAVLQWAQNYLHTKGISEPRAGAEVLLAHCLHCSRLELYLRHDQPLSEDELSCYKQALKRRLAFEPTQYITGHQEFWSLDFLVSPVVLIPRPETELLVEAVLQHLRQPGQHAVAPRILDIGTGSGILAVTLATELSQAEVTAVDRSAEALAMARENARRHGVEPRIGWVLGNLVEFLGAQAEFDVIVSNPPYVPTAEWERLPPDIKNFEPRLALDGGPDGLKVIRALMPAAAMRLAPGGLLALEVGQGQAEAVSQIMADQRLLTPATIIPDYQRIGRVVLARRLESLETADTKSLAPAASF
jgi:release factor glutamine methyltransferase